jgi:hypothetical protein
MKRKNMNLLTAGLIAAFLAATQGGCAGPASKAKPVESAPAQSILTGKVVETMDSGGYTYMCLEKDGKKTWVAAPTMKVAVGDEVQLLPGAEMPYFTSSTLNRTFDTIVFSGGPVKAASVPSTTPPPPKEEPYEGPILAGKVVETLEAGRYSYVRLEKDGKRSWAAIPVASVKVGDEIEILPGTEMGRFTSKSLNRTFENIYFSGGLKGSEDAQSSTTMPSWHRSLSNEAPAKQQAEANPAEATHKLSGKVTETMDAGGYTYICLEKDGKKTWAAVPTMKVNVGDEIELAPGTEMKQFSSKALNRTFDSIIFSSGPITKK